MPLVNKENRGIAQQVPLCHRQVWQATLKIADKSCIWQLNPAHLPRCTVSAVSRCGFQGMAFHPTYGGIPAREGSQAVSSVYRPRSKPQLLFYENSGSE
jgi:hypothetical protein